MADRKLIAKGSGLDMTHPAFLVVTVRDDLISQCDEYLDRAQALAAAGLLGVAILRRVAPGALRSGGMDMENEYRKVDALKQVLEAFNRHDLDAIMSHFVDDCVFESPRGPDLWGRRFVGKEEVRRGLAARFEGIPDVQYGNDDHFACGNRGVSEWTISGTTVEGERIEVRGCDLWTFGDDGKLARKDSFWKIREP